MSTEFWVQMIVYGVTLGGLAGATKVTLKNLKTDITRLERKQDKHNNLVEKFAKVEAEHNVLYEEHRCPFHQGEVE